jgi:hypothetical protein
MTRITGSNETDDQFLSPPTPSTLNELGITLVIAQTHLLELIAHDDSDGRYSKAYELVQSALALVQEGD